MRQRDLQQALLRGTSINDTAFATLVQALNDCPSLQTLDLSQCLGAEVNIVAGLDWVKTMKQLKATHGDLKPKKIWRDGEGETLGFKDETMWSKHGFYPYIICI